MWVGIIRSVEGRNTTKSQRKSEFAFSGRAETSIFSCPWALLLLFLLSSDSDWALHPWLSWFSSFLSFTGTTGFPRLPSCRYQIIGLLSLHYYMNQSFMINLSLSLSLSFSLSSSLPAFPSNAPEYEISFSPKFPPASLTLPLQIYLVLLEFADNLNITHKFSPWHSLIAASQTWFRYKSIWPIFITEDGIKR